MPRCLLACLAFLALTGSLAGLPATASAAMRAPTPVSQSSPVAALSRQPASQAFPLPFTLAATSTYNAVHLAWTSPPFPVDRAGALPVGASFALTGAPGALQATTSPAARSWDFTALRGNLTYTFTLVANSLQAPALIATASIFVPALPTSRVIAGITFYYQTHNLSCEETATSMALTHQRLHISQNQILSRLGVDWTRAVLRNGYVVRWGDPDKAFVGNVNGSENNYTGQQANPKALVRVLKSYHAKIITYSEPGVTAHVLTASNIYNYVLQGHPVVAYATWDWKRHRIYYYKSEDGNRVPLISPWDDHVYTVVGVTPTRVLIYDPIRGQYWISKAAFQAGYEFGMAIVLQ